MTDKEWEEKCNLYIKIHDAVVRDNEKLYAEIVRLKDAVLAEREACAKVCEEMANSDALSDIEKYRALFIADQILARVQQVCERCGKVNPAEIHTCTPQHGSCSECGEKKQSDGWALYCVECLLPMREWQGLTRDQVSEIWVNGCYEFDPMHAIQTFARAIEAKLKEKNK